jgi:hypothetical protein
MPPGRKLRGKVAAGVVGSTGVVRARVVSVGEDGRVFVIAPGLERAKPASVATGIDLRTVRAALEAQHDALVVFEEADKERPIVLGFVTESGLPRAFTAIEADVDGKRVRVVAQDEIVLECGKASITLRRNGKVVVRGTHVETSSEGTNRIKGGQVKIN